MNPETAAVIQTFEHCFLWFQCTIIPQLAACVFTADLCPTLHRGLAEVSVAALQQLLGGLVACLVVALEQKTSRSTPPLCSSTLRLSDGLEWIYAVTQKLSSPYNGPILAFC